MKLRTSFFNPTVFRKDLTRFAPTWVLYTVYLFMMLAVCMDAPYAYRQAENLVTTLSAMAVLNMGYGFLNGQLLFGDLFSSKHCNALHAMPLRRECWFVTHTVSGLLFSFGPNLVMSLVAALILKGGWLAAALWLIAVSLQYLFFFGLSALSALCVGNRFAMVLVYGIINFLAMIVYWFYFSIYEPLLYGVSNDINMFNRYCPVWMMSTNGYDMVNVVGKNVNLNFRDFSLGEGWGYLAICAAIGVGLLGLAMMLYRRRKLESAGDFMAVRPLEPVFLGLYTLSMAAFFQMFADLFEQSEYFFLGLGIVIGFFTGLMLIRRTIRVFQPRSIIACVLVGVVFAGSLLLTKIDPLGVTRHVPKAEQVEGVYLDTWRRDPDQLMEEGYFFNTPEDVEQMIRIHQAVLDQQQELDDYYTGLCLTYKLKNGKVIQRYYPDVAAGSDAGELAAPFLNNTAFILGGEPEEILKHIEYMTYYGFEDDYEYGSIDLPVNMRRDLMQAIVADCNAGRMAQHPGYRDGSWDIGCVEFAWEDEEGRWNYRNITIFSDSYYTLRYLNDTVYPWLEVNSY